MTEISSPLFLNFLIFLTIPFLAALIVKKIHLSPIIGYIIGGLILGNWLGHWYSHQLINNFAYLGIVFLLFTVGLEINLNQILVLKKFIVIGGLIQLVLSIFFITLVSLIFKFNLLTSFLIGVAFSSSSTAMVAKLIQDRGEEGSFLGELALGILMLQNIAFIPFLILFTSITNKDLSFAKVLTESFVGLVKSTLIISFIYYFGQKIIPRLFNEIARLSTELLNLMIIVFIFLIVYLSLKLGIPVLIGAFIAGILVGQTIQQQHIFSQVRSMRDLLAVIFFVFIGLNIRLDLITNQLPKLILFFGTIGLVKWLIIFFIFIGFKFHTKTAFSLSSYLFQIDEDAFILMSQALANKVVSSSDYSLIIGQVVIALMVTPILIRNKDYLYNSLRGITNKYLPFLENYISQKLDRDTSPVDVLNMRDHVVICGYGRVGSYVGRALMLSNIPFIAIDYNFQVVEKAKQEGVNIIYGDPTDIEILDYVQVDEARALISVVPGRLAQETIVLNAKKLNPKIVIFNRIHQEGEQQRMKDLGVDVVIQPEFEASLSIIRKILLWRGIDKEEITKKIKRLKVEHGML